MPHAAEEVFGKEHVAERINCRQRQLPRGEREKHGEDRSPVPDEMQQATRGLVNMGFGASDVKKALLALVDRHRDAGLPPLPDLLREAIAALTS